jgi:hypothetical protein
MTTISDDVWTTEILPFLKYPELLLFAQTARHNQKLASHLLDEECTRWLVTDIIHAKNAKELSTKINDGADLVFWLFVDHEYTNSHEVFSVKDGIHEICCEIRNLLENSGFEKLVNNWTESINKSDEPKPKIIRLGCNRTNCTDTPLHYGVCMKHMTELFNTSDVFTFQVYNEYIDEIECGYYNISINPEVNDLLQAEDPLGFDVIDLVFGYQLIGGAPASSMALFVADIDQDNFEDNGTIDVYGTIVAEIQF